LNGGSVSITNSFILNNRANCGGAFYVTGPNSNLNIESTYMFNNTVANNGGALYCNNGTVGVGDLLLKQNNESYCSPSCNTTFCNLTQVVSSSVQVTVSQTGNKDIALTTIIASSVSAGVVLIASGASAIYFIGFGRLCCCFKRKAKTQTQRPISKDFNVSAVQHHIEENYIATQ